MLKVISFYFLSTVIVDGYCGRGNQQKSYLKCNGYEMPRKRWIAIAHRCMIDVVDRKTSHPVHIKQVTRPKSHFPFIWWKEINLSKLEKTKEIEMYSIYCILYYSYYLLCHKKCDIDTLPNPYTQIHQNTLDTLILYGVQSNWDQNSQK